MRSGRAMAEGYAREGQKTRPDPVIRVYRMVRDYWMRRYWMTREADFAGAARSYSLRPTAYCGA